ncbi:thioredoxin family protein [Streptomyces sp. Y2F8-2]|nr:thioredoxin family protein [Streptomyces sp. Y2F8-2]
MAWHGGWARARPGNERGLPPPSAGVRMADMSPVFRRNSSGQNPTERLVTLIRKPGCHLCDDAQVVIEKVCGELGVPWEQKDITQDQRLHDEYWEQIPVVLVDGAQHTFWRVDEQRLRRALTE